MGRRTFCFTTFELHIVERNLHVANDEPVLSDYLTSGERKTAAIVVPYMVL